MVDFNGALYSYIHNLQGDVVGIVDSAGSLVVEYKYDAWGKPTLVRTLTTAYEMLAELNPFRYRGYVFDEETGLYYLRSRYCASKWNRFLNADSVDILVNAEDINDNEEHNRYILKNLFVYCNNDSINLMDSDGEWWESFKNGLKKAAIGLAIVAGAALIIGLTGGAGAIAVAAGYTAAAGSAAAIKVAAVAGVSSLVLLASTDRPRNNQRQNEQFAAVMKRLGYTKRDWQWRLVHNRIHRENFTRGFSALLKFAKRVIEEATKR